MSNWFTNTAVALKTLKEKEKIAEDIEEMCEHCQKDPSLLYMISREHDSFGVVGEYGQCETCFETMLKEEQEQLVCCHDCKQYVKRGDTIGWKWYDFSFTQGDEPIIVCNDCRRKSTHINRILEDEREYDREFGVDGDEDY
jgi:hypothetical protein